MRSPVCLSRLCVFSLITFEPIGRFNEIQQVVHAIKGDLDAIIFNSIASTILKWWRFKLLRWMQYLHQSALLSNGLSLVTIVGLHRNPCGETVGVSVGTHF